MQPFNYNHIYSSKILQPFDRYKQQVTYRCNQKFISSLKKVISPIKNLNKEAFSIKTPEKSLHVIGQIANQRGFQTNQNKSIKQSYSQISKMKQVQMPSTSFSPFRSENNQQNKTKTNMNIKNVNVSLKELAKNLDKNHNNSSTLQDPEEMVLNETINKLDFLERKIANIMERNDQLQSALRKPDSKERLSAHRTNYSFNEYLKEKYSKKQNRKAENTDSYCNIQTCDGRTTSTSKDSEVVKKILNLTQQNEIYSEQNRFSQLLQQQQHAQESRANTPTLKLDKLKERKGLKQNKLEWNGQEYYFGNNNQVRKGNASPIKSSELFDSFSDNLLQILCETIILKKAIVRAINQKTFRIQRSRLRSLFLEVDEVDLDYQQLNKGKKVYENGYLYEGEWNNGSREGLGTLFGPDSKIIYQGEWKNDIYHGRGRLINEDQKQVENQRLLLDCVYQLSNLIQEFKNFRNVERNWKSYEGEFREGKKNGLGVMCFNCAGNLKFHGNFMDDKFHGSGTLLMENNNRVLLKGIWDQGTFI